MSWSSMEAWCFKAAGVKRFVKSLCGQHQEALRAFKKGEFVMVMDSDDREAWSECMPDSFMYATVWTVA